VNCRWLPLLSFASALAWGTPAGAQSLTADQILQQFNAVIFQNFSSSSDVEGRTVIGGNLTEGGTFALNPTAEAASSFAALTVYGNVTSGNSMNLDAGEGATIAGSNAGSFDLNDGGSVFIGGSNSGALTTTGSGSATVSVVGSNSGQISVSNGGSVYVGNGNSANIGVSGGTSAISINGNNTATLTLNNGGTVKVHGNAGAGTLNGGSLTYTGSVGSWNMNGGATSKKAASLSLPAPSNTLPSFASTFEAPMVALSSQLAALTPGSSVLISGNNVTLEAKPNAQGIAVLDLSTSVFTQNAQVSVALNGASSFIINLSVAGCSSNCSYTIPNSVNFENPTTYADSVLWNLTDVSSMSFTNEFGGTVLAPSASLSNSNPIDGAVIALNFSGTGEIHDYPFAGKLPAPEPSGLAVLAVGLLGVGFLRRGRGKAIG
jgi:choice-of-anchor A domain-containing protein